jgi:hypothetical protein
MFDPFEDSGFTRKHKLIPLKKRKVNRKPAAERGVPNLCVGKRDKTKDGGLK